MPTGIFFVPKDLFRVPLGIFVSAIMPLFNSVPFFCVFLVFRPARSCFVFCPFRSWSPLIAVVTAFYRLHAAVSRLTSHSVAFAPSPPLPSWRRSRKSFFYKGRGKERIRKRKGRGKEKERKRKNLRKGNKSRKEKEPRCKFRF